MAFEIGFSKLIVLRPELFFVQAGYNVTFGRASGENITIERKINYIEVPIWLKFRLGGPTKNHFYIGPVLSLAINVGVEATVTLRGSPVNLPPDQPDFFPLDFGLGSLVGYQFRIGKGGNIIH